jgi:hypothetical protein
MSKETVVAILIVVLGLYVGYRVYENEAARAYPPPACEVFGGSWSTWDGWRCA